MLNSIKHSLPFLIAGLFLIVNANAQEAGLIEIDIPDLDTHMSILASDDMEGRATGEAGLDKAAEYLRSQVREMGLKAIDENKDYFQEYTLVKKQMDHENSSITIKKEGSGETSLNYPFYFINPDSDNTVISGEAVFGGYGIYSREDNYNDFEGLDIKGKILLIMDRGPLDQSGHNLLTGRDWKKSRTLQYKIPGIARRGPKAVLIVLDPKSGYNSLAEAQPGMARYLSMSRYVKELEGNQRTSRYSSATKIIIIHRKVADEILKSTGLTLSSLQDSIDRNLKSISFNIEGTNLILKANFSIEEKPVPNVVGFIEGNDRKLKKEVIVYSAHFDHLGTDGKGGVYNGADDNASGTVALLELGEAFLAEQENLKRSVLLLWVSGEEIGLFGSKYYTENPLIPLDQTIVNINLDMIGTVRQDKDKGKIYGEKVSVQGMDSLSLIGGHQSTELMKIHNQVMDKLGMFTDSSLNDPDHPYRYYYRSDHINFARHNIPVLFYSTGTHIDYHKTTDNYNRINFVKLEKVTDLSFLVGYRIATMPEEIEVDSPFSDWGRMRSY